ncbi:MAG: putative peptidase [Psychrosphaera sp.]|jgi:predicted peptidase
MCRFVILLVTALCLLGCNNAQQTVSGPQLQRITYQSKVENIERDYFVYLPKGYASDKTKQWPLMLFLHGNGERGDGKKQLGHVLKHGPLYEAWIQKKDLPFIIISPQLPMFGFDKMGIGYIDKRTDDSIPVRLNDGVPERPSAFVTAGELTGAIAVDMTEQAPLFPMGWEQVEKDLLDMLTHVKQHYRTDNHRVYLTGLSYGGVGTWYMASEHPQLFAAIAPVVGWGHPSLMEPIAQQQLPVWAFAGGRDSAVVVERFYHGLNTLEQLGHPDVRFTVHEDMGHDTWTRVYSGDDIYTWLLNHKIDK